MTQTYKYVATFLTGVALTISGFLIARGYHPIKHTQVVTCVGTSTIPGFKYTVYYMERPNKEVFTMMFDNPVAIPPNTKLKDVAYTDVDAQTLHFVKAQIQ